MGDIDKGNSKLLLQSLQFQLHCPSKLQIQSSERLVQKQYTGIICQCSCNGYTVLLSTHNPEHALRFATHVLALHGGTVAACGPVEEMLTEELLHTLYRIPLTVAQVPVTGATVRSCVYDPAKP